MLFIDGIRKGIQYENVNYWIQDYEAAFELLTQLVADHWTLEYAIIVDNGDCLAVPIEAFDGQPIGVHIHALQQEWNQALLVRPDRLSPFNQSRFKSWFLQLDAYYSNLLVHLEKMILSIETRKRKLATERNEKLKHFLSYSYDLRLQTNQRLYQQTKKDHQKNQQRLQELENMF